MSHLLPYFGLGLILLVVLVIWVRRGVKTRGENRPELFIPSGRPPHAAGPIPRGDLGQRILNPRDWDFVCHETNLEVRRMFEQERTVLAIFWLRRIRRQVSLLMSTHAALSRRSENLQPATELKLFLNYLSLVVLCDTLIGLIWLCGLGGTRNLAKQAFFGAARLRAAFERLITIMDGEKHETLETDLNHGAAKS